MKTEVGKTRGRNWTKWWHGGGGGGADDVAYKIVWMFFFSTETEGNGGTLYCIPMCCKLRRSQTNIIWNAMHTHLTLQHDDEL